MESPAMVTVFKTGRPILAEAVVQLLKRAGLHGELIVDDTAEHLPDLTRRDLAVKVAPADVTRARQVIGDGGHVSERGAS